MRSNSTDRSALPTVMSAAKPANLRELSAHLRLSQTTVSFVLNNAPAASAIPEHTRNRVLEAARELQYRPNYFARSLRRRQSMSVGVLTPDLSEGYFTSVVAGVQDRLIEEHYFYLTASHYWNPALVETYPSMLMDRGVDGFLMLNTQVSFETDLPIVAVSAHDSRPNVTNIILDHNEAADLALRHLYALGHRQIAVMRGPRVIPDSEPRWHAIVKVARGLGITIPRELCMVLPESSSSPEVGYRATHELLQAGGRFTALFCFNDISAIGAMAALEERGLEVPGDVSVVGFDDILNASFHRPKLTTVRQPMRRMGYVGAGLLLKRIADPQGKLPGRIVMQPELVVRDSTARAKKIRNAAH
ncbi:MAG TPA: LacI family DNA-binding transcriptional regulator [Edaphobacter sp.]|nr:LacI family DNA-binding transcriptional regulator [Edaphobacter sp.]